ncbi:MAG: restriction endonuclease subunit S [Lunatimonas sp.]|uniref:restriction endonuclease subunit S n=1 Tax=Lunatimonas sp. TaxID=2060141 RepID=UPI00263A4F06|nr:restriction endonuclease subunit S [Lunatimonas sp.]MCC5938162.1 restriction endonuclease subunit S [Lunatimonas sp.]
MNKLKVQKYPAYKDSGVEWLGEIPEGWELRRFKYLFKEINERSTQGSEDLLSVSQYTGVTKKSDKVEEGDLLTTASTLEGYKKVYKNDLVSNIMLAWNGSLGFSPFDGITSPAYSIYRLNTGNSERFFHYLVRSQIYKSEFKRNSSGVIESRLRLYTDDFFAIWSILPPIQEQTAIAKFLDDKTAKIDRAIAQKEKMIALLKERKQIIIQNAVTKGLNYDLCDDFDLADFDSKNQSPSTNHKKSQFRRMKDSGVEWIGEIPEHWEVKRCKYLFYEVSERSINGNEELLSVSHMTGVTPRSEKEINMFMAEDYSGSKICQDGDLVYNIMWAWMGALGVANQTGIVSPSYGVYRMKKMDSFNKRFLEYKLKTGEYIEYYNKVSTGLHSSRLRFYAHMFMNMEITFPDKNEQDKIITHIETQSVKIDQAIRLQEQQIVKLKELKSTLIDGAVTGKIRVSEL